MFNLTCSVSEMLNEKFLYERVGLLLKKIPHIVGPITCSCYIDEGPKRRLATQMTRVRILD